MIPQEHYLTTTKNFAREDVENTIQPLVNVTNPSMGVVFMNIDLQFAHYN